MMSEFVANPGVVETEYDVLLIPRWTQDTHQDHFVYAAQNSGKEQDQVIATYDLENRFTYHKPTTEQAETYDMIRRIAHSYATYLNETCPDGREKSLAIQKLEETVMWANAAVARANKPTQFTPPTSSVVLP